MTVPSEQNAIHPGVTVVIPTVGRPQLVAAIGSVRAQDYPGAIEIIVVVDKPTGAVDESILSGADVVLYTGGGLRAAAARNLGIARAAHPYIALLDDDDEWFPWKLSVQMPAFAETGTEVIGTRAVYRNSATGVTSAPFPAVVKRIDQPYSEYLFRRRSPKVGRAVICGITLVVSTELAQRVPWDGSLARHQDWDWVDRMERQGAKVLQLPDSSAIVGVGSEGSISASSDWRSSLAWAETRVGVWKPQVLADFIAGQPLRYALQARSLRGAALSVRAIAQTRRLPSIQTWALGFGGLVPRSLIHKLMVR